MTTDTPDVDAVAFEERGLPGSLVVHIDFARRLRRECTMQAESYKSLSAENKALAAKIESDAVQERKTQEMLEKQKAHAIALQRIIEALCAGKPCPDEAAAPDQVKLGKAFHKSRMQDEANRLAEEGARERSLTDERRVAAERLAAAKEENVRLAAESVLLRAHDDESVSYAAEVEAFTEELFDIASRLGVYLPAELAPAAKLAVESWQQFKLEHAKVTDE